MSKPKKARGVTARRVKARKTESSSGRGDRDVTAPAKPFARPPAPPQQTGSYAPAMAHELLELQRAIDVFRDGRDRRSVEVQQQGFEAYCEALVRFTRATNAPPELAMRLRRQLIEVPD